MDIPWKALFQSCIKRCAKKSNIINPHWNNFNEIEISRPSSISSISNASPLFYKRNKLNNYRKSKYYTEVKNKI